nr:cilia- and flagella-associated protein 300-like [Nerophis lumbriciformis]
MSGDKNDFEQIFTFRPNPSRKFSFLEDKETVTLLMKWSMHGRLSSQTFIFDQKFHLYDCDRFALCFFTDSSVLSSLKTTIAWESLSKPVTSVNVEIVPCTRVSMDLFDPIYTCGIVAPSGHIARCFHDYYPDYDKLREMLQDEDSENYHVLGSAERGEFLFRLFKHLCFGGTLNQYEETVEPYISVTKKMYKELISVQKDPENKKIGVVSTVLKVHVYDESGQCHPGERENEQMFSYLIVDPFKRLVTLLSHSHGVGTMSL